MADAPPPKRLRRRPPKSCEPCRRRKIRCNLELPCASCLRSRPRRECTYRPMSPRPGDGDGDGDGDGGEDESEEAEMPTVVAASTAERAEPASSSISASAPAPGSIPPPASAPAPMAASIPQLQPPAADPAAQALLSMATGAAAMRDQVHIRMSPLSYQPQSSSSMISPILPGGSGTDAVVAGGPLATPQASALSDSRQYTALTPTSLPVATAAYASEDGESVAAAEDRRLAPERASHGMEVRDLKDRVRKLEEMLARQRQSEGPAATRDRMSPGRPWPAISSFAPEKPPALVASAPKPVPRLRNAPNKIRLFGPAHWIYTAEHFSLVGRFDPMEVEPDLTDAKADLAALFNETRSLRRNIKAKNRARLADPMPDLIATIPARETCDGLLACYLRAFEPLYRILHVPSFRRDYRRFWNEDLTQGTPSVMPTHFYMKLVTVLAMGATFYSPRSDAEGKQLGTLALRWLYAAQWWLSGPGEKSTINMDGLQVACLVLLARRTVCNGPGASSGSGSLLTMAMSMGLHRDPRPFPNLSPFDKEMRARLWVTVMELCLQTSLDAAMPCGLSADDYDAPPPSNINDDDMDPDNRDMAAPCEGGLTDVALQILQAKTLPLRLDIQRHINNFKTEQSYDTALQLGRDMSAACREMAVFFHAHHVPQHNTPSDHSTLLPTDFHRRIIDISYRRYILLLNRPFMVLARKEPRYYLARKNCVDSAMVIASYARDMQTSDAAATCLTTPAHDISRLAVVGHGLFKGPPSMDAIAVLCLEVITQLEEEQAASTAATPSVTGDPLDAIHRSMRAPLIASLATMQDRLLALVQRGSVSLKRYGYTSALLGQIRAMEAGLPVRRAVYNELMECLGKAHSLMMQEMAREDDGMDGGDPGEAAGMGNVMFGPDMSALLDFDLGVGWDMLSWYFPLEP